MGLNVALLVAVILAIFSLSFSWPLNKAFAVIIFFVFLVNALPTGSDYVFYQMGFESVELKDEFPYVGTDNLDAEPIYLFYMWVGKLISGNFNVFLALSFLLWIFLLKKAFIRMGVKTQDFRYILICAFPAVIPVVTYWSPRSAFSLPVILFLFDLLRKKKFLWALPVGLLGMLLHSQYIPFICVLLATMILVGRGWSPWIASFGIAAFVLGMLKFGVDTIERLPFLAGQTIFSFALGKLHYFTEYGLYQSKIRASGVMMVFIDLIYLLFLRRRIYKTRIFEDDSMPPVRRLDDPRTLLDLTAVFSLLTNLIFIHDSHIAGRVARFADYFAMCVGLPLVLKAIVGHRKTGLLLVVYAAVSLIIFQGIYSFTDGL